MRKRLTPAEAAKKELMERFIASFSVEMARTGMGKYQLIPVVAVEMKTSTRTIENWLSRANPGPSNPFTLAALDKWISERED